MSVWFGCAGRRKRRRRREFEIRRRKRKGIIKEKGLVERDNKSYRQKTRFREIRKAGGEKERETNQRISAALETRIKNSGKEKKKQRDWQY